MKKKILLTLSLVLFAAGISILFYPMVSQFFNSNQMKQTVDKFKNDVSNVTDSTQAPTQPQSSAESSNTTSGAGNGSSAVYSKPQLDRLYKDMQEYNKKLAQPGGQDGLCDPFAYSEPSFDLSSYGINNSMFGYVEIPQIGLDMPIYLGANDVNMWNGAAHLSYTSIPIGGNNTNAVLAGHRGVVDRIMFDNIVYLNEGDMVYIGNFWGELKYKVISHDIINPTDTERILIQKNKDLLTLITCHPYGYSDQRYIVICERVN